MVHCLTNYIYIYIYIRESNAVHHSHIVFRVSVQRCTCRYRQFSRLCHLEICLSRLSSAHFWSSYTHELLHMDNLATRRKKHTCIMTFKILNGLSPLAISEKFKYVHEISSRETRQSNDMKLYIPKPRLELIKRSFIYRASMLWNDLPIHVRQCTTIDSFKLALDILFSCL